MKSRPEGLERSSRERENGAFDRERSRLERFKTPAAKWLGMAAVALTTQGCARFGLLPEPVVRALTMESGRISGVDERTSFTTEGSSTYEIRPTLEVPGDQQWWMKSEGVYLPPKWKKTWEAEQEKRRSIMLPRDVSNIPMLDVSSKGWVKFESNEVKPTEPVAYAKLDVGESPEQMIDGAVDAILPILKPDVGLRVQWHAVGREISDTEKTEQILQTISGVRTMQGIEKGMKSPNEIWKEVDIGSSTEPGKKKYVRRKEEKKVPLDELRKQIPGAWMWTDEAWERKNQEQLANRMLSPSDRKVEVGLRLSPFVETGTPPEDFEHAFLANAFRMKGGETSITFDEKDGRPTRANQVVTVERWPIPPIPEAYRVSTVLSRIEGAESELKKIKGTDSKKEAELEEELRKLQDWSLMRAQILEDGSRNKAKQYGLKAAMKRLAMFGTKEMRFHVAISPDEKWLVVVGVMDDPDVPLDAIKAPSAKTE